MRYGIFSDVHSNLQACLEAIKWFKTQGIDQYISLGDIINYGASPVEVIELIRSMHPVIVAGNHDWGIVDKFDINALHQFAREALLWSRKMISVEDKIFLRSLKLIYREKNFVCVHSSLLNPQEFNYIFNSQDALLSICRMEKDICFIGHSHRPISYVLTQDGLSYSKAAFIPISDGRKYIINVGSVGQPRDGDNRGCVCIYDDAKSAVYFHRFEYNIKSAADKIINAGLPDIFAYRLYGGY